MNCTDIDKHIDDYVDGQLDDDIKAGFDRHVQTCPSCADRVRDMNALLDELHQLPIVDASPDFERRVFTELRRHNRSTRPGPFAAGFATALAASLAIWFVSTVYLPEEQAHPQVPISFAVNEARTVRLMFDAEMEISQAQLTIGLPGNMELEGYPGRKQLSWQTSLKKGANVLALPIRAIEHGQGELMAQLDYGNKTRTFRVLLKTTDDGVMRYQLQETKSA